MQGSARVAFFVVSLVSFFTSAGAQEKSQMGSLKTVVIATGAKTDGEIAIPPMTSVSISLKNAKQTSGADAVDLTTWLSKEVALNGLQGTGLQPWHIIVSYDQFDEDGDNVHSGVYEEYWAGAKKYRRIYKSDNLNQTDYATDKGLYRLGDQRWPGRAELQVRSEVVEPFYYAATLVGFHGRNVERIFGDYKLSCVLIERNSQISSPTQYCFEPDGPVLRYSQGFGWFQTVYNEIVPFQGRSLAQQVAVTDAGKPYLNLRVEKIELISHVDDADFLPPPTAIPIGDRVSGVNPVPIKLATQNGPPRCDRSISRLR
jgi:hypothetical protein